VTRIAPILLIAPLLLGCNKIRTLFAPPLKTVTTASRIGAMTQPKPLTTEKPSTALDGKRDVQKDLENLGIYLMAQVQRSGRPAGSLAEATVLAEQDPALYAQVKAGIYTVRWGIEPKAFGAAVIAYEAQTPAKGGYVLLGGATVAKATPEEFKSALNNQD
jgi:hypothetical protein